ncbi:unnamed protein product [Allacma fusca]|uniref:Uncharacterized protein n=1 Tax=Allacma fusca TaxID=39272 RepID=A0A8J2JYV5_9HEXA|nr:unnamed protein product [Allacma fusca]
MADRTSIDSLKGEVVLVTGGANGIGRGICREIAKQERDLSVIIWDVNEKAISDTVTELKSTGVKNVFGSKVDVSNREEVIAASQIIRKEIGDVTMLFNNAGIAGLTHTDMTAKIDLLMKRYKFLNTVMTPDYVGTNILHGVLRGKEHIYVPGEQRVMRFLIELLPSECYGIFYDLAS